MPIEFEPTAVPLEGDIFASHHLATPLPASRPAGVDVVQNCIGVFIVAPKHWLPACGARGREEEIRVQC